MTLLSVLINRIISSKEEEKIFEGDEILKFYPLLQEFKGSYMHFGLQFYREVSWVKVGPWSLLDQNGIFPSIMRAVTTGTCFRDATLLMPSQSSHIRLLTRGSGLSKQWMHTCTLALLALKWQAQNRINVFSKGDEESLKTSLIKELLQGKISQPAWTRLFTTLNNLTCISSLCLPEKQHSNAWIYYL